MKKSDDLRKLVDDLIVDAAEDRTRLSEFLDKLLEKHGEEPGGVAEYVSKLADSLTKQMVLKVHAMKVLQKEIVAAQATDDSDDLDDISNEIGDVFGGEKQDEGSN